MSARPVPERWRWLSPEALVVDAGQRPVVLAASRDRNGTPMMVTRDDDDRLIRLDPSCRVARMIVELPGLVAIAERLVEAGNFPRSHASTCSVDPELDEITETARALLARIFPPVVEGGGP